MSAKSVTLKERFEIHKYQYTLGNGKKGENYFLVLPGEGFEVLCDYREFQDCPDPEDAMRDHAVEQFGYELRHLENKFKKLSIVDIEHWYNKEGNPCYLCTYLDFIPEHYEDIVWDPETDPEPPDVDMKYAAIWASDLEELELRLEIALEEQNGGYPDPEMPEWSFVNLSFKKMLERQPELNDSEEFWWLMKLLVFGIYEEREFARRRINEMIALSHNDPNNSDYKAMNAREAKKAMYRKMSEPQEFNVMKTFEECSRQGIPLFEEFLNKAIESKLIHSPSGLATSVGVKPNYLSNARTGKRKLSKAAALRLGIGLRLSPEDMTRFLASLDHLFPISKDDFLLCDEFKKGNYDLDLLVEYLPPERTDENKGDTLSRQ